MGNNFLKYKERIQSPCEYTPNTTPKWLDLALNRGVRAIVGLARRTRGFLTAQNGSPSCKNLPMPTVTALVVIPFRQFTRNSPELTTTACRGIILSIKNS